MVTQQALYQQASLPPGTFPERESWLPHQVPISVKTEKVTFRVTSLWCGLGNLGPILG